MKAFLSVLLLLSLTVSPATAQEGQHPRPALIPGVDSVSFTLRTAPSPENVTEALRRRAEQLRQAEQVRSIGKREGDAKEMFGKVADIEVVSDGQIYVLDERYSEIRQYGSEDVPVQTVGQPGQGPKEFKAPTELALFGDTLLAVLDPQRVELTVLRRTEHGFQHRRTIRHSMPTAHMCHLGDRIILQGVRPPRTQDAELERKALGERPILHVYGLDGTLRKSFGDAYQSEDVVLSLQLSEGPVGCVEEEQMLVTALQGTSMLYGYDASGSRAWATQIEDYTPVPVQKEGRTTTFGGGDRPVDVTRWITPLPTGEVLIQVSHTSEKTTAEYKGRSYIATYLLSPATGRGVFVGKELPPIMDARGRRLYAGVNGPYPRVEIYAVGQFGKRR